MMSAAIRRGAALTGKRILYLAGNETPVRARHRKQLTPEEDAMFFKKEAEATEQLCDVKIKDILNDTESEFTIETLRDMQTLTILKDAARQKLQKDECY